MLTPKEIRLLFVYDPADGILRWRHASGRHGRYEAGSIAGYKRAGYWMVEIGNREYRCHRLVWAYVHGEWPCGHIDHKDCDRSNNRIDNLRIASRSQNSANRYLQKNNSSGFKGVYRHKKSWAAVLAGRHLGIFETAQDAANAYAAAALERFGEFARTGR